MLLTITAAASPEMPDAADLGYLLHKHPDRAQASEVFGGTAHVLWPEVSAPRATCALLLDIDTAALGHAVDDRPYAASSLLSTALGKVFRTATTGRCDARPDLAAASLDLQVHVPSLSASPDAGGTGSSGPDSGPDLVRRLFAPLGWDVTATALPLDPQVPPWGPARVVDVVLRGRLRLADALTHLWVLLPVLDDAQHYWVGETEVEVLLRRGGTWLADHPERALVSRRFLRHQRGLLRDAEERFARLADLDDAVAPTPAPAPAEGDVDDQATPASAPLAVQRREAVLGVLREVGAQTVVDLGCGEGSLVRELLRDARFTRVVGADVSARELEKAARRVGAGTTTGSLPDSVAARLELLQTSATYRDERIAGVDAVTLVEVVEHLDPPRLPALERSVFAHARPATVVVTTPNRERNVRYPGLPAHGLRHPDHRFEWTRAELAAWAGGVAERHGYAVRYAPVGDLDPQAPEVGAPTQMAVFTRTEAGTEEATR